MAGTPHYVAQEIVSSKLGMKVHLNLLMNDSLSWIKRLFGQASDRTKLVLLLAGFGILLTTTIVPGVFIIDEDNYLVTVVGLQHGMLKMPGMENLTPSRELVNFDPGAKRGDVQSAPVVSYVRIIIIQLRFCANIPRSLEGDVMEV